MRCPMCGEGSDRVIDSREAPDGDVVRRRRVCEPCGHRFTTYERIETTPLIVVKKDGRRETFRREKLLEGVFKALHRRPVPAGAVHEFARQLEVRLGEGGEREVPSSTLGDRVMEFLRAEDAVAYVRFASVYREFRDIDELLAEMRGLAAPPPVVAEDPP